MRKSIIMVTILYLLAFVSLYGEANATPTIDPNSVRVYTDYIGPNGGFIEEGRYFVIRAIIMPSTPGFSITAIAKQDSVEYTLNHSPQPLFPLSDLYVFRTSYTGQGGAWEITADDGEDSPATITTYALNDPKELPLATNLSVSGELLRPTLTWVPFDKTLYPSAFPPNPSAGYDIYTQTVMIRLAEPGMPILYQSPPIPTDSATYNDIPADLLEPNKEYLFDLFLVHLDFDTTTGFNAENMSETFVYYSTVPPPEPVAIDIKPGSDPNSINPCSRGKIPVAILTTDTFDASTVDPNTVLFGSNCSQAAPVQSALEDVDGDGDTDMILHFNTQDTWIQYGDTSASLTGETVSGQTIQGSDSIKTVECKKCFPPPVGLTGWWPGDGNTDDIIGGRSAVLYGNATTGPGFVGDAFILDGDGDFVDVPDGEALKVGTGDFTVDLWVFFNDTAGEQILVEKWVQLLYPPDEFHGSIGWTLTKLDGNFLLLAMADGSGVEIDVGSDELPITAGTWNHFAATRRHHQVTLFLNGAPIAQGECSLNLNSTSSLKFGHRGNKDDTEGSDSDQELYLNGRIDEVELFVGQALTECQIRAIFNAGRAGKCKKLAAGKCFPPPAGLTGWWPGDGNTDDIIGGRTAELRDDATTGPGLVGEAFILDGDGDFVEVPHDEAINLGTWDFTVDLWVFFNDTTGEQVLVEKWIQGVKVPSQGWTLTKLDGNVLLLAMNDISGEGMGVDSGVLPIPTGTWTHFAATRQGTQVTLFMNGAPVAQGESSLNLDSTSSLKFGHRGNMYDTEGSDSDQEIYLNGRIDEVELFVGQALTNDQIQAIFNARSAGKCKD